VRGLAGVFGTVVVVVLMTLAPLSADTAGDNQL
jgi:hypothetical protein